MVTAISLPKLELGDDDNRLIQFHLGRMARYEVKNRQREAYREGRQRVKNYGHNIPAAMQNIKIAAGWPGQIVKALDERLDFQGWSLDGQDPYDLMNVYRENSLDVDAPLGHVDALTYGTGFVLVGKGEAGEPDVLVTVESARRVTGEWSNRLRRLTSAISIDANDRDTNEPTELSLYLPDETIRIAKTKGGVWKVEDRDEHKLGRVAAVMLPNQPTASNPYGQSEITRPIRSYTDQAVRTLLDMEVNRTFFSSPQRYALGIEEGMFQRADGTTVTGWEAIMGAMLALPKDEDGDTPTVGQFPQATPGPYLDQVRGLAQMVAAEASIPASYMGFEHDNPTSADAIRQATDRHVKRAERRQVTFGRGWREVAALSLLIRDGELPDDFSKVSDKWRDAATPTRSAAADEATKLIGSGVLLPDSEVTYDRVGLTPAEKATVKAEKRRAQARETIRALAAPQTPAEAPTEPAADTPEA